MAWASVTVCLPATIYSPRPCVETATCCAPTNDGDPAEVLPLVLLLPGAILHLSSLPGYQGLLRDGQRSQRPRPTGFLSQTRDSASSRTLLAEAVQRGRPCGLSSHQQG